MSINHFNSRAHVERDREAPNIDGARSSISTHALTWSATLAPLQKSIDETNFNSRAHVERDRRRYERIWHKNQFQLTRSRGARPTWCRTDRHPPGFQLTRSRGARRTGTPMMPSNDSISTHALTWSATSSKLFFTIFTFISTHALTWSATGRRRHTGDIHRNFNSRAHVERDRRGHGHGRAEYQNFNSRAHVERDDKWAGGEIMSIIFQLTRSRGARR